MALRAVVLVLLTGVSFGCSSSIFTGDHKSDFKDSSQNFSFNPDCKGIDLSSEALSAPIFRQLVHCLNSNNSISAYDGFAQKASDAQLGAVLDVVNRNFALNRVRLKQFDRSFAQMDQSGALGHIFAQFDRHLSNPAVVLSALRVLREAILIDGMPDAELLAALKSASQDWNEGARARARLNEFLEYFIKNTNLSSYKDLVSGLSLPIGAGRPLLHMMAERSFEYLQEKIRENKMLGKEVVRGAADGSLFSVLDAFYLGSSTSATHVGTLARPKVSAMRQSGASARLRASGQGPTEGIPRTQAVQPSIAKIAELDELMRFLLADHKSDVFEPMSRLFGEMNGPISCLDGTKRIDNAAMLIMDEMGRMSPKDVPYWLLRKNVLKMKLAADVCQLPRKFNELAHVFERISDGDPREGSGDGALLVTTAELVAALKAGESGRGQEAYRKLFVNWLGDPSLVSKLGDGLSELARRDRTVLPSALLLLEADNRRAAANLSEFILRSRTFVPGKKPEDLYDLLSRAILRVRPATFADFVVKVSSYLDEKGEVLAPLALTTREALLSNDVSPVLDALVDTLTHADANTPFFKALLELSGTPEFENALRLTAAMSRNGTLKDLLSGVLLLYRGGLSGVDAEPRPQQWAAVPGLERGFDRAWKPGARPARVSAMMIGARKTQLAACRALDVDTGFSDTARSGWNDQMLKLSGCVNAQGAYQEFEQFMRYATDGSKTVREGKPFARFLVDRVAQLFRIGEPLVKRSVFDEIGDLLVDNALFADLKATEQLGRFFFRERYCGERGDACASYERLAPAQALGRLSAMLAGEGQAVQPNLNLAAKLIEQPGFPSALRLLVDVSRDAEISPAFHEPVRPELDRYTMEQLRSQTATHEDLSGTDLDNAVNEKAKEYLTQLQSGVRRFNYRSADEFKGELRGLVDKLADPKWRLYERALKFMRRMDSLPYDPAWWSGWIARLASNKNVIPYYYPGTFPGKDKPTVRVVNQLDVLELVVIDANFSLDELGQSGGFLLGEKSDENFALRYLTWLAEAGDDLSGWVNRLNADLEKHYNKAFNWPGVKHFMKDELLRHLFNLHQLAPILIDMNKQVDVVNRGGSRLVRNDLGILRDMFRDILDATPPAQQHTYTRESNSLSSILELTRFGLLRNLGISAWYFDGSAKSVDSSAVIRVLTKSAYVKTGSGYAINEDMRAILEYLLTRDRRGYGDTFHDRYALMSDLLDAIFKWTSSDPGFLDAPANRPRVMSKLKAGGYEALGLIDSMDRRWIRTHSQSLIPSITRILRSIFGEAKGASFVARNLDRVRSKLSDSENVRYLRELGETGQRNVPVHGRDYVPQQAFEQLLELGGIALGELALGGARLFELDLDLVDRLLQDPQHSLDRAVDVCSNLNDDREFKSFRRASWDRVSSRLMRWFANSSRTSHLAPRLQQYLAERLRDGDFMSLISFIGRESGTGSDVFYEKLKFIGQAQYIDGMNDGLEFFREGLRDTLNRR